MSYQQLSGISFDKRLFYSGVEVEGVPRYSPFWPLVSLLAALCYATADSFSGELSHQGPKNLMYQWPGYTLCSVAYLVYKKIKNRKNSTPVLERKIFFNEEN